MDLQASCLTAYRQHFATVWSRIKDIPHRDAGILPSEMVAFIAVALEQGVTLVVESGRKNGFSTEALAACTGLGFELISIELDPILEVDEALQRDHPKGVTLVSGNGRRWVPYYVRRGVKQGHRVAVLLDGPKGLEALKLFDRVGRRCTHGAIHDASRRAWRPEAVIPNPVRQKLDARACWFTDDPDYHHVVAALDERVERPDFANTPETFDCAYTLAILSGGQWRSDSQTAAA